MAHKIVATIGAHKGAWVFIRGLKNPKLNVKGHEGVLVAKLAPAPESTTIEIEIMEDGVHPLEEANYLQVDSTRSQKGLICTVTGE